MILSQKKHNKLLKLFSGSYKNYEILCAYEQHLYDELTSNLISPAYAKRQLESSANFFLYCQNFKNNEPSLLALDGYLWIHPWQKYFLSEFTSFLSTYYSYKIDISRIQKVKLQRPKRSHQILKKRLVRILQNPDDPYLKESEFFRVLIGYLHWIDVPQNVYLDKSLIEQDKNKIFFIFSSSKKFYIPTKIKSLIFNYT